MKSALKFGGRFALVAIAIIYFALPLFPNADEVVSTSSGVVPIKWDFGAGGFPVQWNLNPAAGSNISGGKSVANVIQSSFNTWLLSPNAALPVTRGADSSVSSESNSPANIDLVCFVCADGDFSKDSETLAVTMTTFQDAGGQPNNHGGSTEFAGQLIKADILFNPNTKFATDPQGNGQDLTTVATHEIGHFFGLDHSAVVAAVMFPFAAPMKTTLSYDDVAGIANLYPKPVQDFPTVSISGAVSRANTGAGVFGAHVYADSTTAALPIPGAVRKSPIGTLTITGGVYSLQGLPPDSYIITAEPLDQPVQAGDVSGFGPAYSNTIETNFTTRWH